MRQLPTARYAVSLAGALFVVLAVGGLALWQGDALPVSAATSATPAPCLVDRDVPYYGGAAPVIARPSAVPAAPTPPPPPNPGGPTLPGDRYIPPRPPLQNPCQLQLLDGPATP